MVSAGLRRAVTTVLELRWDVFRRDSSRASRYLPSPSTTLIHVRRLLLLGSPPRSRDGGRRAAARTTHTRIRRSRSRPLIDDPAGSCRAGQGCFAPSLSPPPPRQSKLSYSDEVRVARGALGSSRTRASRPPPRPTAAGMRPIGSPSKMRRLSWTTEACGRTAPASTTTSSARASRWASVATRCWLRSWSGVRAPRSDRSATGGP